MNGQRPKTIHKDEWELELYSRQWKNASQIWNLFVPSLNFNYDSLKFSYELWYYGYIMRKRIQNNLLSSSSIVEWLLLEWYSLTVK